MTNPYSMSTSVNNPYNYSYPQKNYKDNSTPSTFGIMTLGAIGGGIVGFFKNRYPIGKDGTVSDTFAKEVFERNLAENRPESSKNYFYQLKNVLKKLDKINSPEEFKTLLNQNKEILEDQCRGISSDTLLDAVNSTNLKNSKKALKESLEAIMNFEIQKTKNAIKLGWNSDSKKFIKTPEFKDNKLFEIITNTKSYGQWKKALKYGGITSGILGALTIGYKMLVPSRRT